MSIYVRTCQGKLGKIQFLTQEILLNSFWRDENNVIANVYIFEENESVTKKMKTDDQSHSTYIYNENKIAFIHLYICMFIYRVILASDFVNVQLGDVSICFGVLFRLNYPIRIIPFWSTQTCTRP